ncbi:MAG: ACT domain-containing protein [Oceanospirillaceae bacterium]|nr:ACT domain-containing protein [Oceanospirillaceae bacterium]
MNTSYVLSFSAQDKPGIVELLSNTISSNGGNWLESAMSHLAGRFVGIVIIDVAKTKAEQLKTALHALHPEGFFISVETVNHDLSDLDESLALEIELTGHDRPGLVSEISTVLSKHGANVEDLTSELVSGSMSAELLFKADIHVSISRETDIDDLQEAIEAIADDLMVDIVVLQ